MPLFGDETTAAARSVPRLRTSRCGDVLCHNSQALKPTRARWLCAPAKRAGNGGNTIACARGGATAVLETTASPCRIATGHVSVRCRVWLLVARTPNDVDELRAKPAVGSEICAADARSRIQARVVHPMTGGVYITARRLGARGGVPCLLPTRSSAESSYG